MNNFEHSLFSKTFSHVYIEEDVWDHPRTKKILSKLQDKTIIGIKHYKDIFCRTHQDFMAQKQAPALILAKKEHHFVYPGAKVCQSFGNANFYYTSCVMNCIYQCEYCYLEGMYASAHIVVFVNLEDFFSEVKTLSREENMYLCISYDTDILALENLLGYGKAWIEFLQDNPNVTIEIRTKSANFASIQSLQPIPNVILAWTLSPNEIASKFEHGAPSLQQRLEAVSQAIAHKWRVRLCLDPMITTSDYQAIYSSFIKEIFAKISPTDIQDMSIGLFRVSKDYLKRMRKQNPDSIVLSYPYELSNGVYEYEQQLGREMITFLENELTKHIPKDKIFNWENT